MLNITTINDDLKNKDDDDDITTVEDYYFEPICINPQNDDFNTRLVNKGDNIEDLCGIGGVTLDANALLHLLSGGVIANPVADEYQHMIQLDPKLVQQLKPLLEQINDQISK